MAPKYKLTYFNFKALGEPIRYLLAYGGADFEDERVELGDWPRLKPDTPLGRLPLLDIDGKRYHQSAAIMRYLARQFGLAGDSDLEALQIDATADTIGELRVEIRDYLFPEDEAEKPRRRARLERRSLPFFLARLEQQARDNGGYFVNGRLSYADVMLAGLSEFWAAADIAEGCPQLQALVAKVNALPRSRAWRAAPARCTSACTRRAQ